MRFDSVILPKQIDVEASRDDRYRDRVIFKNFRAKHHTSKEAKRVHYSP